MGQCDTSDRCDTEDSVTTIEKMRQSDLSKKLPLKKTTEEKKPPPEIPPAEPEKKIPAAALCEKCRCPVFWIDVYGNGPHCADCTPWPNKRFVRQKLIVCRNAQEAACWENELSDDQRCVEELDREFERKYATYETRKGDRLIIQRRDFRFTEPIG